MTTTELDQAKTDLDTLVSKALDLSTTAHVEGRQKAAEALTDIALTLDRARFQLEQDGTDYLEAAQAFVTAARNHFEAVASGKHIVAATAEAGEDVLVFVHRWADVDAYLDRIAEQSPCTVRRAKGRQRIDMDGGGSVHFALAGGDGHRGRSVAVVYLARGVEVEPGILGEAHALTCTHKSARVLVEVAA